jgi:hypothetical protein
MRLDWIPIPSSDNVDFNSRHSYWHSQKHQSPKLYNLIFFIVFETKSCKHAPICLAMSVCLSICLFASNNMKPAERIFIKFHIGEVLLKFVDTFHFSLKSDNNIDHHKSRPTCVSAHPRVMNPQTDRCRRNLWVISRFLRH